MTSSIKTFIIRYICLKILLNNVYSPNEEFRIPSENQLAEKFNCTRLTARSALNVLENQGILTSRRGSCYRVEEQASRILLFPNYIHRKYPKVKNKVQSEPYEEANFGKYYKIVSVNFDVEGKECAKTIWKLSTKTFNLIKSKMNDTCDVSTLLLNSNAFGEKIVESFYINKKNELVLHQQISNGEDCEIFYSSETSTENIKDFSKRKIVVTK